MIATVTAGAGIAWYCRTPSGRQKATATLNLARHKIADWIKPVAKVEEEVIDHSDFVHSDDAEWTGEVPTEFLDNITSTGLLDTDGAASA